MPHHLPLIIAAAVGWAAGRDGKPGTADDLRLGYLPAQWSIEPADAEADKARDQDFVGRIGADGVFVPGDAGPNPARPKSLGNTGRVNVVAVVDEAGGRVEALLLKGAAPSHQPGARSILRPCRVPRSA